jgi:hypothetical protein
MKIAIMQPYFFPYIGYFQLINAVDKFVILDDVNFIMRGWINRNRILVNSQDSFIIIPLRQASQNKLINETFISDDSKWQSKLLRSIELAYKHAPQFNSVFPLIANIIQNPEKNISIFIHHSLLSLTQFLGIQTQIITSSSNYNNNQLKAQERIIDICFKEKAVQYINPCGGIDLYSNEVFKKHQIELRFLKTLPFEYKQFSGEFIPSLSIIDVMMFVEKREVISALNLYSYICKSI